MLVDNAYMGYDMTFEEYYLTIDGVTKYTSYTNDEVKQTLGNTDTALKNISHNVYRLIDSKYIGQKRNDHKKYMRKLIYDNANGEVHALMFAMLEAVKGAIESGMDLNAYINNPTDNLPPTTYEELRNAMLIDLSQKPNTNIDITYTDTETAKWSE